MSSNQPEASHLHFENLLNNLAAKSDNEKLDSFNYVVNQLQTLIQNQRQGNSQDSISITVKNTLTLTPLCPGSEQEIQDIVRDCKNNNKVLRVIGAGHSADKAFLCQDDRREPVYISLTKFRNININPTARTVEVEAGANIGKDPNNPDSTIQNSLIKTLDDANFALSCLGGITHQTVGGFLSTGSSGGSTTDDLYDDLIGLRIVDGKGEVHDLKRDSDNTDLFYAAGVSMGLLGVITKATFKLKDRYDVKGEEDTYDISECPLDMFGNGEMQKFLEEEQFTRIMWWPQPYLNRVRIWKGRGIASGESPQPPKTLSPNTQKIAHLTLLALNMFETDHFIYDEIRAFLLARFNPQGKENFRDRWWKVLPMDDYVSDVFLPVSFTELWIPIQYSQEVMVELKDLFSNNFTSVGNFFTEIYAAKKSDFWLRPSYGSNMIRVDVNYFRGNILGTPEGFYSRYWDVLNKFKFKCHWGKYIPDDYAQDIGTRYPKYGDWIAIREQMDPNQIFVTPYWRTVLKIPRPASI